MRFPAVELSDKISFLLLLLLIVIILPSSSSSSYSSFLLSLALEYGILRAGIARWDPSVRATSSAPQSTSIAARAPP